MYYLLYYVTSDNTQVKVPQRQEKQASPSLLRLGATSQVPDSTAHWSVWRREMHLSRMEETVRHTLYYITP